MYKKYFKRLLDIIISVFALILFSPILLILAVLIRITLGAPIIFKQKRPGKNGKIFEIYKFRTMNSDKDVYGNLLSDNERLTSFGRFIRSTSLDELPELINILKGEMSLVGPRPLLVEYLTLYSEEQKHRHDVLPGLTGWAQVNGRNAISWNEKFKYDLEYVENISFLFDVKVVFYTIKIVLTRSGINQSSFNTMDKFRGEK